LRIHDPLPLALTFDDVLMVPKYSTVRSRSSVMTTTKLGNLFLSNPFIAANMDTVCEKDMSQAMNRAGGLGIIHRNLPISERIEHAEGHQSGIAFGVNEDYMALVCESIDKGIAVLCLDIAHGNSNHAISAVNQVANYISDSNTDTTLIAGNVATSDGFKRLSDAGANAIKVGIGGGGACTTRTTTGFGVPQFSAVLSCVALKSLYPNVSLISDGGIRTPGDACKAIGAGADAVMMGTVLAGCTESPGKSFSSQGVVYKRFRGMASADAGSDYPEGDSGWVKHTGPVVDIITAYNKGLRSAMSYCGAEDIASYKRNVEFIQITQTGKAESHAHAF